jgi:dihydrofolate synthase/folylpolyglutamate synthase
MPHHLPTAAETMTQKRSLHEWLDYQQQLHPAEIELGLGRLREVWGRLHPGDFGPLVISVAGTNGKGSCVAYLEAMLAAAAWRVGSFTSPHLLRYNERIRIGGSEASDAMLCEAFAHVEQARGSIPLTYFEYATLAALDLFARASLDVVVLEVGLGGRLDAVNLLDADAALVTSVGIDHQEWLGDNRDAIGAEKAGILRAGAPAVYAEADMPPGFRRAATEIGADLYHLGDDYNYSSGEQQWSWRCGDAQRHGLPIPAMRGSYQLQNAAGVLTVLHLLRRQLPVSQEAVRLGLLRASLPGRFQVVEGEPLVILDVAHNREAAAVLAATLRTLPRRGKLHAVFSMFADKPIRDVVAAVDDLVDSWHLYALAAKRGCSGAELYAVVQRQAGAHRTVLHGSLSEAFAAARRSSTSADAILVFGSFEVVGAALEHLGIGSRQ